MLFLSALTTIFAVCGNQSIVTCEPSKHQLLETAPRPWQSSNIEDLNPPPQLNPKIPGNLPDHCLPLEQFRARGEVGRLRLPRTRFYRARAL